MGEDGGVIVAFWVEENEVDRGGGGLGEGGEGL